MKDQIRRQLRLVAPHHPPDARIDQPVRGPTLIDFTSGSRKSHSIGCRKARRTRRWRRRRDGHLPAGPGSAYEGAVGPRWAVLTR